MEVLIAVRFVLCQRTFAWLLRSLKMQELATLHEECSWQLRLAVHTSAVTDDAPPRIIRV